MHIQKLINSIFVSIFVLINVTFSQIPESLLPGEHFEFKPHSAGKFEKVSQIQKLKSNLYVRPYDVLKYNLYMDWYNLLVAPGVTGDFRQFNGCNTIHFKIDSNNIQKITLDAINMLIDSVISYETKYKLKILQNEDNVVIDLPSMKFSGDTLTLKVFYTYIGKENDGMYIFDKGYFVGIGPPPKRDSICVLERIAWTMSEPQDARKWMPCNDSPFDKAMVELNVKVPRTFTVAANGILEINKTVKDSTFYHFVPKYPMSTYLIAINASKFTKHSTEYVRLANPKDTVPIDYYMWEQDWTSDTLDGGAYNAEFSFRNVVKMMQCYSSILGEYPFEKYGMVVIQPFNFGGMEHQTMTTINRSWLRGTSESGIAHELFHQWLGDLMTCATWYDVWINEGGGTWGEALWREYQSGSKEYFNYMNRVRDGYFKEESIYDIPIYGVPISSIFTYPIYLLEYNKASWIYHMLRTQLGDEVFFPAFNELLNRYRFKSIETIDMVRTLKELIPNSKVNFDTFFDQWIMKAGHPILSMKSTTFDWGSGKSKVNISLKQIQEGINTPAAFSTLIEFQFFKNSKLIDSVSDVLFKPDQSFEYFLDFYPDSIAINQNKLLCQLTENVLSIKATDNIELNDSKLYPNPLHQGEEAHFYLFAENEKDLNLTLYDSFGRIVNIIFNGKISSGNYEICIPTKALSSGAYFLQMNFDNKKSVKKLVIIE